MPSTISSRQISGGSTMSTSNANPGQQNRQVIRPTPHIPWSVDVVRLVPKRARNDVVKTVASCSGAGWAALTAGDGFVYIWQQRSFPLSEKLEPPEHHMKLFFADLIIDPEDQHKPNQIVMAISASNAGGGSMPSRSRSSRSHSSSSDSTSAADAINFYVWDGRALSLRKLSYDEMAQVSKTRTLSKSHTAKTRIDLDSDRAENITSMKAEPGFLVLGSSLGNLFWVTFTPVPVGLHVQKITPQTGWLSRVVFGSSSETGARSTPLVVPLSPTEFLSVSQKGGMIMRWKATVVAGTAHHASFELLEKEMAIALEPALMTKPFILAAALASDKQTFHAIARGTVTSGETKLFWVHTKLDGTILRCDWLSRFAEPEKVELVGLIAAENGTAYAALLQPAMGGVLSMIMAFVPEDEIIQEVDLPPTYVPSLLPNVLDLDTVTHGCSVMVTSGLGLRVRFLPPTDQPASKRSRLSSTRGVGKGNASLVQTMVSHLRSAFWQAYQDPSNNGPIPPSLHSASPLDLEQAVLIVAAELQHKGDAVSAQNPMEWHRALIKFLQERGVYRSVSQAIRWQLLSIGQELAVFGYITQHRQGVYATVSGCKSYDLANWLQELQEANTETSWNTFLAGILDTAIVYQEETSNLFYDLIAENPRDPIWLSHKALQTVMLRQLEVWFRNPSAVDRVSAETVVKATLRSYATHYTDKELFVRAQTLGIGLLRALNTEGGEMDGDFSADELAFDLSIQYNYFEGLCQISVDHDKKRDSKFFSLDPLFQSIQGTDLSSGFSFAQYVLQWHTDKGLYGHTINYGRHCPGDLTMIMNKDERLRQYKWIPAIRQSFFEQATESCLANCDLDKTLGPTQWALSMAKLANKLVVTQNKKREDLIERKLELVNAQLLLEADSDESSDPGSGKVPTADNTSPLRAPEELVHLAIQRVKRSTTMDDRIGYSASALAVCAAIDDDTTSLDHTALVWAEALRLDADRWTEWLRTETDLTSTSLKELVLESTVFGRLLEECRKTDGLKTVTYGTHLESHVIEKMGGDRGQLEFSRLLRCVSSTSDTMQGKSLVVATF